MNDIVHLAIDSGARQLRLWTVLQVVGQLIEQAGSSAPQALNVFELIGSRTGAAGVTDLLFAASSLRACCAETRRARSTGRPGTPRCRGAADPRPPSPDDLQHSRPRVCTSCAGDVENCAARCSGHAKEYVSCSSKSFGRLTFPIAIVILSLIGDWLKRSFRRLLANARRAPASRRRIRPSNDWRNGQLHPAGARQMWNLLVFN